MKRLATALVSLFLMSCSSSEGALDPIQTAEDAAVPSADATAVAEVTPADTAADVALDVAPDVEVSSGPIDLCDWPAPAPAACAQKATLNLADPEHLAVSDDGDGGVVVAWSVGDQLSVARLDDTGSPTGETYTVTVESPISGLAAAPSDQMMMVFYSTGRIGEAAPEDVLLRYRPIAAAGIGEAVTLAENFELRPGGIPTLVGPRVQGITREVKGETTYTLVALTLLNHDGTVRTTHNVRVAEAFDYYRIHASGSRANYPFVDAKDRTVSYYEQSVHLLACGLPLLPSMVLKSDSKMLATSFWDGVAIWLVRNPEACDGAGGTRLTFHQTGPRISEHVGLAIAPTDLAEISVRPDDGRAVLVDEDDGVMTIVPFDVGSRSLGDPAAFTVGSEMGQSESLHPIATDDGWLVVRIGTQPDGSKAASFWKNCGSQ